MCVRERERSIHRTPTTTVYPTHNIIYIIPALTISLLLVDLQCSIVMHFVRHGTQRIKVIMTLQEHQGFIVLR